MRGIPQRPAVSIHPEHIEERRLRPVKRTIVFLGAWAMMSAASAHAQTPESTVPLDTTDIVDITGRGSLGVSGGAVLFLHGGNYGNEGLNKTRLIGQAVFKYNFTPALAGVAEFGWGWNTYSCLLYTSPSPRDS